MSLPAHAFRFRSVKYKILTPVWQYRIQYNIIADMGYAYGHLLAEEIKECYYALLYSLLGTDLEDKELIEVLGLALDWQWRDYLVRHILSVKQNTLI